jgi:hypothetical protein
VFGGLQKNQGHIAVAANAEAKYRTATKFMPKVLSQEPSALKQKPVENFGALEARK